jgi:hypothetical protein
VLFNRHSEYVGQHALLSASKHHWLRYTDQKLEAMVMSNMTAVRGTRLHALAAECISLQVKLPANGKTINAYVNDAIGYRMQPEVTLFYSANCFGTADAVGFRRNKLRIHDLKNGINPTSFDQLYIYSALFCLEYGFKPMEIETELRIYQNDDVKIVEGDPDYITHVISKIREFDKRINEIRAAALG